MDRIGETPIPNLGGSKLHAMAVEVYGNHQAVAVGLCIRCGKPAPCPARMHAASVIRAAGEDPSWYDRRPSPPPSRADERSTTPLDLGRTYADHIGYPVGGRDVHDDPAGFLYEREQ